jgi:hypothetical protein
MIKNLRDVGLNINKILGYKKINEGILFRSGSITNLSSESILPPIKSILNLKRENDPKFNDIIQTQACPNDSMNNYEIESTIFKDWIQRVFASLSEIRYWPLLIHCHAGKDRTGIVVALILKNIGIQEEIIIEEYLLSEGNCYPSSMKMVLERVDDIDYLKLNKYQKQKICSLLLPHEIHNV